MEDVLQADLVPLTRLADGTVKQISPFTGNQVWTVPGRSHRPLAAARPDPQPLLPEADGRHCAFCDRRYLETTPELERVVRLGERWTRVRDLTPDRLHDTVAEFRLFANLFEIVSYDYWVANHGYQPSAEAQRRHAAYSASAAGRRHLLEMETTRLRAQELTDAEIEAIPVQDRLARAIAFFAACHTVVVARRHFVDGATTDAQLASSGTLSPDEHEQYLALMADEMRDLYERNPHVRYVSAFQNWLRPAGASFDHLHKQLVGIDEFGVRMVRQLERLDADPGLFARWGPGYAAEEGLVFARTRHAVAFAGVGHRYPSVEVWARVPGRPWELAPQVRRELSDLVHACHAATGPDVPVNEEWHHQPPSVAAVMPTRVVVKWRISTPAGFEGGTHININTVDPWSVRSRMSTRLRELQHENLIGEGIEVLAEP